MLTTTTDQPFIILFSQLNDKNITYYMTRQWIDALGLELRAAG